MLFTTRHVLEVEQRLSRSGGNPLAATPTKDAVIKAYEKALPADFQLEPGNEIGTAKAKDKKEEFLSQVLARVVFDMLRHQTK